MTLALAHADVVGNRYESEDEWGVRISAPTNWDISEQTSYPNILVSMYRRSSTAKMLFAAECLKEKFTSRDYAERTVEALESFKDGSTFQVGRPQLHAATGAYWFELENETTFLRQALIVSGDIGYSLTLSADTPDVRRKHLRAWDYALRSVRVDRKKDQQGACTPIAP